MKQFLLVVLFSIYSMSAAIAQSNVVKGSAIFIKPTDEFYKQAKAHNQLIKENSIWGYIKHLPSWGKWKLIITGNISSDQIDQRSGC